jgi:hypothetical protein
MPEMSPRKNLSQADPTEGAHRDAQVHAEKVALLFSHSVSTVLITIANSVLLALIQWNHVPHRIITGWLAYMVLVSLGRMALGMAFHRARPGVEETARWSRWTIWGSGLAGIGWGLAGLLLTPEASISRQFFTTFVLAGMSAAAMTIMSPVYPAYVAFLLPAGIPILLVFASREDVLQRAAAFMIFLFVAFLLKAGRVYSGLVHRSITLAHDKTELVQHLALEKGRIEELNANLQAENAERLQAEKALEHRLQLESLITSLSNGFINLSPRHIDDGIRDALARLGRFSGDDRSFLFLLDHGSQTASKTHEWVADGIPSAVEPFNLLPVDHFPWILDQLKRGQAVHIPTVAALPFDASAEKTLLESQSVQSVLVVPVFFGESLMGFLGFSSLHRERRWDDETVVLLRVVGEMFANALEHKRTQEELMLARDAAEEAARVKSRFLANMSHEIRTPMHGVLGMLQLLRESNLSADQLRYSSSAHASATMLLNLLDDILDFSRIEAGKLRLEHDDLDLDRILAEVAEAHSDSARARGLSIHCHSEPYPLPKVRGDITRLRQILMNLVGNALKFTEEGRVEIFASQMTAQPHCVRIRFEVRDTGIGIQPEMQAGLFDPFTQADSSTTRRFGGTGLGLAICKQLVDLMGGKIGVVSRPGEGSLFWLELELERAMDGAHACDAVPPKAEQASGLPRFEGFRVLLVEDNPTSQEVGRLILSHMALDVDVAEDGRQAIDLMERNRYDLVFMDCQMPVMDGFEATRLVREREKVTGESRRVIIALTGNAMEGDRDNCIRAGMDDYLAKPFTLSDVSRVLCNWLKRPPDGL